MTKKCIVHYGIHKTGSSSIQKTLQRSPLGDNFYYLNLTSSGNHSKPIYRAFSNKKEDERGNEKTKLRSRIIDEVEHVEDRVAIISGESISVMPEESLVDFRNMLSSYFDTIELVGYIRSPASFIESAFQQIVKGGASDFNPERLFPNYRRIFSRMERVFGPENIHYWKFDPKNFTYGCVATDFCSRLDIPINQKDISRTNEGVSLPALKLLYIYSKLGSEINAPTVSPYEKSLLIRSLSNLEGPKVRLHSDVLNPILKKNADSINWMERRLGHSLMHPINDTKRSIKSEEDLLTLGKIPKKWLAQQLGPEYRNEWRKELNLITIAEWMKRYQEKISLNRKRY